MIKKLFFMAALLTPGLACGANPSADLSVQIVPAGSPPVPAGAQSVGFTTLAYNYDFTDSFHATLSNWLDCAGASSPQWWVQPYLRGSPVPCSAFTIINDGGTNALDIHWDPSYFATTNSSYIETANSGQTTGHFFPLNVYLEAKVRVTTASYNTCNGSFCNIADLFTWTDPHIAANALEWDIFENATDGGWASGGTVNYAGGAAWSTFNFNSNPKGNTDQYNVVGALITIDSSGNLYGCMYKNNVLLHCSGNLGGVGDNLNLARNWIKMGAGPQNTQVNTNNPSDFLVEWIHVWSCANWATQQCYTVGPAAQ